MPAGGPFFRAVPTTLSQFARRVTEAPFFQRFILAVILFAGVLVGVETDPAVMQRAGTLLHALDRVVLAIFVAELVLRLLAEGSRPWRFFRDPWNVFDFVIVAICLLPFHTEFAAVLRLARVLRVLRLVTAVPRLQILVGALLKSVPSMGYVALLLSLHFYVYAVVGVTFFGQTDPDHFGSLGRAGLTLFQIVTLEGWVDIMEVQTAAFAQPWIPVAYFVSFILFGTMIMLNLLIGVIVNGMDEAREETEDSARASHLAKGGEASLDDELIALQRQIETLGKSLGSLQRRVRERGR